MTPPDANPPSNTHAPTAIDGYVSPLATRNASPEMQSIWSPRRKFETWRRLWLALAEAEHELGLPITTAQLDQLRANLVISDADIQRAAVHERRLRHDVMAHVHTLGDAAPDARAIIHLGATSQFVNCNTELLLLRQSLDLVAIKLARVIDALADFAVAFRDLPTLAFTHFQPAQPTTLGKRAANWAYDLALTLERIERTRDDIRLRGVKGATGSQASFLELFNGDAQKVEQLDELVVARLGFDPAQRYTLTGQTYPRVVDTFALADLASVAAVIHKICNDIRLMANRKELDEPFGESQIGSSAMPYKRNPMRCERATGLCRFVISLTHNAYDTCATQWLERTLDDSANRRLSLPESFLALDGALDLLHGVASGLDVHTATVRANLMAELPFLVTENCMMAAVKLGRDRQDVHEAIRQHSRAAQVRVKDEGLPNDLLDRLRGEPLMQGVDLDDLLDPMRYVGLAPRQVDAFIRDIVAPIRERLRDDLAPASEPSV
ncbi:MAG: adenylosuccinate lyase [Phycisphaeraceae bacterium]|nr:adenylosuccinate lyase [Phycisphaeraceae bacterium]MCB9847002.1 adenylosuccinate lyase [Phycisphaeraceae bacterium]